jgi:DNA ligase (NAD+)
MLRANDLETTEEPAPEACARAMKRREERVRQLEREVRRHRELYYLKTPEISDAEFDALENELRELDPDNAVLAEVGAPVASDSGPAVDLSVAGLPTKPHKIPMGSLEKIPEERLDAWAEKAGPLFLVQEKLDGISLEIEYERGKMRDAITRGDGFTGEVITHNAVHFQHVKRELPVPLTGSVRGEVILRKSVFTEHFAGEDFANPRNTVSGTARKKHGDRSLSRHFEMYFYDVIAEGRDFATEHEKMDFLEKELGLRLAVSYRDQELAGVRAIYGTYLGTDEKPGSRFGLDYEIDGLVVRADSIARQRELGTLHNRPRFATAYKFPSIGREAVLRAVDWSLGIGGRVTPVGRVEPVQVGGVTVSNITLHNADYIRLLGLRVGDVVLVERKGDVIPQIVRVMESKGGEEPRPPTRCPVCSAELEQSGKHLRCPNRECPGKPYGDLMKWIGEMEIDSLGEKWVAILIEKGLVSGPDDLYGLTVEQLVTLDRMGETLAAKVVKNIAESRAPGLDQFIAGLNIPEFSRQRAQVLISAGYDTLEKLQGATVEDFAAVKGFAEVLAEKAVNGLALRRERIEKLLRSGVTIEKPSPQTAPSGPLAGQTFCFTGAIHKTEAATGKTYTRKQMESLVTKLGGRALSDVTSKLDYLVMADPKSKSSKAEKARKLGTKILSEEEFFQKVE